MTPNLFLADETRAWLRFAQEDLLAARALRDPATLRSALFHCQQAAEKSLKGFLTWRQTPFPKTHSLAVLAGLCTALDASLEIHVQPVIALTRFAVAMRYPGEAEQPSVEELQHWLALAEDLFAAVCGALPPSLTPKASQ